MNQSRLRIAIGAAALALAATFAFTGAASAQSASKLNVSPAAISFGSELVLPPNGLSKTKNVTLSVSKKAPGPVTITSIASSDQAQFAAPTVNPCPSVAQGTKCSVPIVFTPSKVGKQSATLTITSDASNPMVQRGLSGIGRQGRLALAPNPRNPLNFGKAVNGFASKPRTVTLTNKNPLQISLNQPSISNPVFQVQNSNCGATLSSNGGSCQISMVFIPPNPGTQKGTLSLTGNFVSQVMHLTGVGLRGPTPTPTPPSIATPTPTPTPTAIPTATATPTPTPVGGATATPTATPTSTSSLGATPSPTATPLATGSATPTGTPVASPTPPSPGGQPYLPLLQ